MLCCYIGLLTKEKHIIIMLLRVSIILFSNSESRSGLVKFIIETFYHFKVNISAIHL